MTKPGISFSLRRLSVPLFVRLPLAAAGLVLVGSVAAMQFAFLAQGQDLEVRAAGMGKRHISQLATAIAPLATLNDADRIAEALHTEVNDEDYDNERALYYISGQRKVVAAKAANGRQLEALPKEVFQSAAGTHMSEDGTFVWAWRPVASANPNGPLVVAALDTRKIIEHQRTLMWQMIAICIAVATLAAVLCFFLMRRILDPIQRVAKHLALAGQGQLDPIPDTNRYDAELATLAQSFNGMVAATRDREMMMLTLAEQDRAAVLGRLVASIVHEVRNPLAGMLAAIETIRRFGKDAGTREEALSLIQRGLNSIGDVIDATLETYRFPRTRRNLTREDLADVEVLIETEARQRGLTFERAISLKGEVGVSALEARQILLNLLLNACEATPTGGTVSFAEHVSSEAIEFTISDNGPGLSPAMREAISDGGPLPEDAGLGLPIVLRLVRRLGGRIRARAPHSGGTIMSLSLPIREAVAAQ
jgi:signal transduction histidine kinase